MPVVCLRSYMCVCVWASVIGMTDVYARVCDVIGVIDVIGRVNVVRTRNCVYVHVCVFVFVYLRSCV